MITNLHSTKPETILFGTNRKGRNIAFINFNPRPASEEHQQTGMEWEADGGRYVLSDFSLQSLVSLMEPELLLKASEEEIATLMDAFHEQDNIDSWKLIRIAQIKAYDSSEAVNSFVLGSYKMWLDKGTRVGLVNSVQTEKAAGRTVTTLWYNTKEFQLPVDMALALLSQLELYALDCFNITAKHMALVESAEEVGFLKTFDIRGDYPAPLILKMP